MSEAIKETVAVAVPVGLDWSTIKKGLERLLPLAAVIARVTPNPYDDMAIAFLRSLVEGESDAAKLNLRG